MQKLGPVFFISTLIHGCVPTWCLDTVAWAPTQNSVAFRHWGPQVSKYHLVPEYNVRTCGH